MLPALGQISLDTKVAIALLSSRSCRFELLTGHSKGNLVLSEALYELDEGAARHIGPTNPDPWIVTLSAAVAMPRQYKKIVDVIGSIDGFGALNSTPGISIEKRWPMSWHHTNAELAFHLPVTKVFQELKAKRGVLN
jgi:hypothetical protein